MENHFAKNLPLLRRRAGYTQETLAEALGVSRQAVGKWESGQALPEAATLLTLADLLGCTLDTLMREELPPEDLPAPTPDEVPYGDLDPWYLWAQHIDRFSWMVALGVALILSGVSFMMTLLGFFGEGGLVVVPLLLCVASAVFLFVSAGLSEDGIKKQFPTPPPCPDPAEHEAFHQRYRLWLPAAVAGILVDVAVMIGGVILFERSEAMVYFVMAAFLGILAACVGLLVYLGIQSEKFPEEEE